MFVGFAINPLAIYSLPPAISAAFHWAIPMDHSPPNTSKYGPPKWLSLTVEHKDMLDGHIRSKC